MIAVMNYYYYSYVRLVIKTINETIRIVANQQYRYGFDEQ